MRALSLGILSLALSTAALAGSELQLDSNMPVVLVLDGESAGTVQPLEPLLVDIDSGVHNLTIKGILGKELYNRDLIFDDDTRTELLWQRRELRLGQVVKLDPNRAPAPDGEPEPAAKALAVPAAPPEAPAAAPTPPAAPEPPPTPVAVAPKQVAPPVVREVTPPAPPAPPARPAEVVIEATEDLNLQITHGTQLLRITVEDGELVIVDSQGTEIHFPAQNKTW